MDTVVYMAIERYRRVKANEIRLEASKKDLADIVATLTPEQVNDYVSRTMAEDSK